MFQALYPHHEDRLQLRLHRARSVILTPEELVEIRAAQRTFEGAYMRTALSQFSFALVVLKIFNREFYAVGALFAVYGVGVMLVAIYRRYEGNRQFFTEEQAKEDDDPDPNEHGQAETHHRMEPDGTYTHVVTRKKFRTSGNSVAFLTALSVSAYLVLIVLLWRMRD